MKKKLLFFLVAVMSGLQAMALSTTNYMGNNYIEAWGQLKLVATPNSGTSLVQLADKNGKAVQLRGWATHGYQWGSVRPFFDEKSDIQAMKNLGANVVRLTCYVNKAEIDDGAWNNQKTWLKNAIQWAEELGMYAIVDYHVLPKDGSGADPNDYLGNTTTACQKADDFFAEISEFVNQGKNGSPYIHVLYEICNEPGQIEWDRIKTYAEVVLPKIADNDPHAVVIIGTPQWSQLLNKANGSKITYGTLQIMYTFHFYACTHGPDGFLNSEFTDNMLRSIPVFATEWNDSNANGRGPGCGTPPSSDARNFINRCNNDATQRVSWTAWSWSPIEWEESGDRVSSSWAKGSTAGNYELSNLSPTGRMIYDELQINHINYLPCESGEITVTFSTGEGGTTIVPQVICSGSTVFKPANPRREGFKFIQWLNGSTPFTFTTALTSNTTLTAEWEEMKDITLVASCDEDKTEMCTNWYPMIDKEDGSGSTVTSVAGEPDDVILKVSTTGGKEGGCLSVTYSLKAQDVPVYSIWGSAIGLNLSSKSMGDELVPVDLTEAQTISFYHKGDAAVIHLKTINPDAPYKNFEVAIDEHADWTLVEIYLDEFAIPLYQPGEGTPLSDDDKRNIVSIAFQFSAGSAPRSGSFSVDEITIHGVILEGCGPTCANEITVTFDPDGGLPAPTPQVLCADNEEPIQIPTIPEKPGFDFIGWFDGEDNEFNFNVAPTADVELIAKWAERTCTEYTATFNSDGGSTVPSKTVCVDTSIEEPAAPIRSGFTFNGWFDESGAQVTFPYLVIADVEFTAQWEEKRDPNGPSMVADCEYGNRTCFGTYWYTYSDVKDNKGASVVTPAPSDEDPFTMTSGGAEGSDYFARVEFVLDKGENKDGPFIGLGFDLAEGTEIYDLSATTGISFSYIGNCGFRFRGLMGGAGDAETALGWNTYGVPLTGTSEWQTITITWDMLEQLPGWGTALPGGYDPSLATIFQWQVDGETGDEGWFGVDQVQLLGTDLGLSCDGGSVGVTTTESASFAIYPNPAQNGNFNVTLSGNESADLSILNLQGQVVYSAAISNGAAVNANLGTGVYVVSVKTANSVQTQKLIVK